MLEITDSTDIIKQIHERKKRFIKHVNQQQQRGTCHLMDQINIEASDDTDLQQLIDEIINDGCV